jgi:hypothetical protein
VWWITRGSIVLPRWQISLWYFRCLRMGKIDVITYKYVIINRLMHALFHIKTVIILRDRYRPKGFSPRVDIGRGMIRSQYELSRMFSVFSFVKFLSCMDNAWMEHYVLSDGLLWCDR